MKPSPKKLKETKNIYHKVVDHLISEGYATDSDSADNIIKGMSDEWFETIIEDSVVEQQIKPGQMFPGLPNMGANRPYQEPFINPSGSRSPVDDTLFIKTPVKKASKPSKPNDEKTA